MKTILASFFIYYLVLPIYEKKNWQQSNYFED